MKIAIIGYSGAGKSTLARKLGQYYGAEVLHFDAVHFLPGWQVRPEAEKREITAQFLDTHEDWVIEGNYSKLYFERRMQEADRIVVLLFNRFACLLRVWRRYRTYRGQTRPDMGAGCNEKLDADFVKWILLEGRNKKARGRNQAVIRQYREKVTVIRNQRQLDRYLRAVTEETK